MATEKVFTEEEQERIKKEIKQLRVDERKRVLFEKALILEGVKIYGEYEEFTAKVLKTFLWLLDHPEELKGKELLESIIS